MHRDWKDAREKIDGHPCRVCGQTWGVEAAHIAARQHDKRERGATVAYVDPASVIPLCGPATSTHTCHGRFDAGTLDLSGYLSLDEELEAVRALGGIEQARRRIIGSVAYRAESAA